MAVRFPPRPKPAHHRGTYQRRSLAIRTTANANPNTPCQRCGLRLDQHPNHKTGRPPKWTAGHITEPPSTATQAELDTWPLGPEASTCNLQAGARLGNQRSRKHKHGKGETALRM